VHGDSFSKLLPRVLLEPSVGPARTTDLTAQPLDQPVRLAERTPLFVYPYVIRAYSPRPATIRHAREPRAPARNVPAAGERHAAAAGVKLPVEHGKQEGCLPACLGVRSGPRRAFLFPPRIQRGQVSGRHWPVWDPAPWKDANSDLGRRPGLLVPTGCVATCQALRARGRKELVGRGEIW
jgi:hypothetical protein